MERKPLKTVEEIDAAYPEHAKLRAAEDKLKAVEEFLFNLHKINIVLCVKPESLKKYTPITQSHERMVTWAAFGIDYEKIMSEKEDMLKQLQLAGRPSKTN